MPDETISLNDVRAWSLSADTLQHEYKLHPTAAHYLAVEKQRLISSSAELADAAGKLGIRVIALTDKDYPSCLREYESEPPPVIYAYGNLSLLRERKFAVISSSTISARSTEIIREITGMLSDNGLIAVTSHNTHPYQTAGLAAKSRKASLILVLDRGILSAFPQGLNWEPVAQARIWNLRFDPKCDLVLSRFRLYDKWIGANGKERDRMVFGLADVVVAVEVSSGGVMEAECLRAYKKGREVYVYKPDDGSISAGNQVLLERGCTPIPSSGVKSILSTLDLPDDGAAELE
jgi:predicted Rossmann fold nucleotide-binding protein DprA/Smf involved in DNA uptake